MKMDITKLIRKEKDDYIFNLLGIDNFNKNTSHLRHLYQFIIKQGKNLEGDIFEFGCYRGRTLLALGILLKKLSINKNIYAFDTFKGFPSYHKHDSHKYLKYRKDVYFKHCVTKKLRQFVLKSKINKKNISTSLDFANNIKKELLRKIKFLKLDNLKLIEGRFSQTVPKFIKNYHGKIFCVNMDSDLYESYKVVLPLIYPKLIKKGYIHLDEYYSLKFPGCKIACDDFANKNNIKIQKNKTYDWEFERYYIKKK